MTINAALRRLLAAGVLDISASGCLVETHHPTPIGAIGLLQVEIDGVRYAEWFRVQRVEPRLRASDPYVIGVEFLQLSLAGEESLRGAVRTQRIPGVARTNSAGNGQLSGKTGNSVGQAQIAGVWNAGRPRRFPSRSSRSARRGGAVDAGSTVAQRALTRTDRERSPSTPSGEDDMKNFIARFVRDEQGQDLIEYVLIATFTSVGALAGATALGLSLNDWYDNAATWVDTNQGPFAP